MIKAYTPEIEAQMQELYNHLPEKNRRLYAGVEALKLPYGGISYIAKLFSCSRDTVILGMKELKNNELSDQNRSRKVGGGRKPKLDNYPDIDDVFLALLKGHTAGDPMDEKVKWTDLTRAEISTLLAEKGFNVSRNIVKKLLKKHGYVKRQAVKNKAIGEHVDRNAQFEHISELKALYESKGDPILSVDTKKKNL